MQKINRKNRRIARKVKRMAAYLPEHYFRQDRLSKAIINHMKSVNEAIQ